MGGVGREVGGVGREVGGVGRERVESGSRQAGLVRISAMLSWLHVPGLAIFSSELALLISWVEKGVPLCRAAEGLPETAEHQVPIKSHARNTNCLPPDVLFPRGRGPGD